MNKKERQQRIIELLQSREEVYVSTICNKFKVVPMTVRRDLSELEKEGILIRTHGGAILKEKRIYDSQQPFTKRIKVHRDSKEKLALRALDYIKANDRICILSGSTMEILCQEIPEDLPLTIVTNSINAAHHFAFYRNVNLIVAGGQLRANSFALVGSLTRETLAKTHIDKAFLGVNGVDEEGNIYSSSVVECDLIEELCQTDAQLFVLADESKLFHSDLVPIKLCKPYTLITTAKFTQKQRNAFQKKGISIILAYNEADLPVYRD